MKILDLSCGNRAIWFDKNYCDAVYIDIREKVFPDIVADSRSLPESVGDGYSLVVFDPPHVNGGVNGNISRDYGHHTTAEIRDIITKTGQEAHRVTVKDALMAFKWNDHDQSHENVLALLSKWWEPLVGTTTSSRTKHTCTTQWVLLRRRDCILKGRTGGPRRA